MSLARSLGAASTSSALKRTNPRRCRERSFAPQRFHHAARALRAPTTSSDVRRNSHAIAAAASVAVQAAGKELDKRSRAKRAKAKAREPRVVRHPSKARG